MRRRSQVKKTALVNYHYRFYRTTSAVFGSVPRDAAAAVADGGGRRVAEKTREKVVERGGGKAGEPGGRG